MTAGSDLGTLGGPYSDGYGINQLGQAVGDASLDDGDEHAFRTAPNAAINPATDDLGTLGGSTSFADGINASGQTVGRSYTTNDDELHAFRSTANGDASSSSPASARSVVRPATPSPLTIPGKPSATLTPPATTTSTPSSPTPPAR
jgi:probable HAF family extracellular repeat protein